MANFIVIESASALQAYQDFRLARIDGRQAQNFRSFYEQIARALEFPDDFGYNLDVLDEFLNDLSWLDDEKIALYITHTDSFLAAEKSATKKADLLNLLDITAEDWKWVDEEDEETTAREFVVLLQPSEAIRTLLDQEGFEYEVSA